MAGKAGSLDNHESQFWYKSELARLCCGGKCHLGIQKKGSFLATTDWLGSLSPCHYWPHLVILSSARLSPFRIREAKELVEASTVFHNCVS